MKIREIFELQPLYRKSFYGKAKVAILDNGDGSYPPLNKGLHLNILNIVKKKALKKQNFWKHSKLY